MQYAINNAGKSKFKFPIQNKVKINEILVLYVPIHSYLPIRTLYRIPLSSSKVLPQKCRVEKSMLVTLMIKSKILSRKKVWTF